MIVLSHQAKVDSLNVKKGDLLGAKLKLKNILSTKSQHFQHLASAKRKTIENAYARNLSLINRYAILSGIISLILEIPDELSDFNQHFDFFAYYFTNVWDISPQTEQTKLLGQLESGLKNERALSSLYYELLVIHIYTSKSNKVQLNDLSNGEAGSFDLIVEKSHYRYCVEIKTIDYLAGLPFNHDWMMEAINILSKKLSSSIKNWQGYHAQIHFIGPRQPSHNNIISEIHSLSDQINERTTGVKGNLFSIQIKEAPADFPENFMRKMGDSEKIAEERGYVMFGISAKSDLPGLLTVESNEEWSLSDKINSVIKEATNKQLPPDQRAVLWIQLNGSTATSFEPYEKLLKFLNSQSNLANEIQKRQKHKPGTQGLIGVHLTGDAYIFPHKSENLYGIDLNDMFISSKIHEAEANIYQFLIMNKLPSKLPNH